MKKRFLPYLFTLVLFITNFAKAESFNKDFVYKDYSAAKSGESSLIFKAESSKLGFIHSSFEGRALRFGIGYDRSGDILQKMRIHVDAKSFDTDNNARNNKMNELCLESQKFPEIIGEYSSPIDLNAGNQSIVIAFTFKGKQELLPMKLTSNKIGNSFKVKIEGPISLKAWNIPDPSIAIASVKDQFDLLFEAIL